MNQGRSVSKQLSKPLNKLPWVEQDDGGGGEAGVGLRIDEWGTRVLLEAGGGGSRGIPAFLLVVGFWVELVTTTDSDETKKYIGTI